MTSGKISVISGIDFSGNRAHLKFIRRCHADTS
jgi:hypothetical protein